MAEAGSNQKPTALVSVDIAGFARETEEERRTVDQAYEALTARLEATAQRRRGEVFEKGADGFKMAFPTADAAVQAAEEIADGPWPPVKVGAHLGKVVVSEDGEWLGQAIAVVAGVQQAAGAAEVLASTELRAAVEDQTLRRRLARQTAPIRLEATGENVDVAKLGRLVVIDPKTAARRLRRQVMIGAGVTIAAAAVIWLAFGRDIETSLFPRRDHVAVLKLKATDGSKDATEFAESVTDEIGYGLRQAQIPAVAAEQSEKLRGSDRDHQAKLMQVGAVLDGEVSSPAEGQLAVKLRIDDPVHHKAIWTHEFAGSGEDLTTQVSARVNAVLTCAARALRSGGQVSDPAIASLYLKFCDANLDAAGDANALAQEEASLRDLIAKAPSFSYGHSSLALFLMAKASIDATHAADLVAEAGQEAAKALQQDAANSDAYEARARLAPPSNWPDRERDLAKAVSLPGSGAEPGAVYSLMLSEVGRVGEAAAQARKVASEDVSGDPDYVILLATASAAAGRADDADAQLTKALQIAPASPVVQALRYKLYTWTGRYEEALRILQDEANRPPQLAQEDDLIASKAFLTAMISQDPRAKAAAREAELASARRDRGHVTAAISHLSALGLVDDAVALARQYPPSPDTDDLSTLFSPLNAALRADPRFMEITGRAGLNAYWSKSGRWPDFCATSGLAYTCKASAG